MKRFVSVVWLLVLVGLVAIQGETGAPRITEDHATIGENCTASGDNATAMGLNTAVDLGLEATLTNFYDSGKTKTPEQTSPSPVWALVNGAGLRRNHPNVRLHPHAPASCGPRRIHLGCARLG